MENVKCEATFIDPIYKGAKCNNPANYFVKINNETEYIHPRCGTHSRKINEEDKIPIKGKKENVNKQIRKNTKFEYNDEDEIERLGFKFDDLLKYLESDEIKTDIPQEVEDLYKVLDNINNYLEIINTKS